MENNSNYNNMTITERDGFCMFIHVFVSDDLYAALT